MYSIFNTNSRKRYYLEEGESPSKKIITEGDILIKTLTEKQLKSNTSISEVLMQKKDFVSSEKYSDISNHISGESTLRTFKASVGNVQEWNVLKNKNLSDRDITLFKDYIDMGSEFWTKNKHINKDVLTVHINNIETIVKNTCQQTNEDEKGSLSRHQKQYLNSLKPYSLETKLLKFATENTQQKFDIPGPIDELPHIEKEITKTIEDYTNYDYKKIQKKARSMGNKIKKIENDIKNVNNPEKIQKNVPVKQKYEHSLWDAHEKALFSGESNRIIINRSKIYDCKPQNFYTMKDGQIIKLNARSSIVANDKYESKGEQIKLTLEEIKRIPKFAKYETGNPSKILFIKNLVKSVEQSDIQNLLENFTENSFAIRIMNGKMKGQAFIEFKDEILSAQALNVLNGVLLKGKPIIAQFGHNKVS